MNITSQVCSLEQAKKLKQLGVTQNSFLYWHLGKVSGTWLLINEIHSLISNEDYSAFTVGELGVMLPYGQFLSGYMIHDDWGCGWYPIKEELWDHSNQKCEHSVHADTEAQARAALLIYLIENKHAVGVNERLIYSK